MQKAIYIYTYSYCYPSMVIRGEEFVIKQQQKKKKKKNAPSPAKDNKINVPLVLPPSEL